MFVYVIFWSALALLLVLSLQAARTAQRVMRTLVQSLPHLEEGVAECRRTAHELTATTTAQRMDAATQAEAGVRALVELRTGIKSLADLQHDEFSRVRALLEVLPHSVAALKRELAQLEESTDQVKAQLDASSANQGRQMSRIAQLQESTGELKAQLDASGAGRKEQLTRIAQLQESTGQLQTQFEVFAADQTRQLAQIRAALPPPRPAYVDPVPFIEGMAEPDVLRIAEALVFVRPLTPYPNWYFDVDWQNPDLGYRIRRSIWTYFSRRKTTAALDTPWYGGLKLRLNLGNDLSRQQFVAGCLDPNEFALLDKLLTPGMVFLDAGANEGWYTVFAAHRVGNTGTVWAFEPSTREMEHLAANVRLNGLANVRPFCLALADEDTHAELLVAGNEHSGHNTLGQLVYESELSSREPVLVRRLDSLLQENSLDRLDFLKIDTEGAEARVLAGARAALSRFRPLILLEVNDPSLKAQGSSRESLIHFLESQAYRLYLFDPVSGLPVPAFEGRYGDNMLAVPLERDLPESVLLPLPATGEYQPRPATCYDRPSCTVRENSAPIRIPAPRPS